MSTSSGRIGASSPSQTLANNSIASDSSWSVLSIQNSDEQRPLTFHSASAEPSELRSNRSFSISSQLSAWSTEEQFEEPSRAEARRSSDASLSELGAAAPKTNANEGIVVAKTKRSWKEKWQYRQFKQGNRAESSSFQAFLRKESSKRDQFFIELEQKYGNKALNQAKDSLGEKALFSRKERLALLVKTRTIADRDAIKGRQAFFDLAVKLQTKLESSMEIIELLKKASDSVQGANLQNELKQRVSLIENNVKAIDQLRDSNLARAKQKNEIAFYEAELKKHDDEIAQCYAEYTAQLKSFKTFKPKHLTPEKVAELKSNYEAINQRYESLLSQRGPKLAIFEHVNGRHNDLIKKLSYDVNAELTVMQQSIESMILLTPVINVPQLVSSFYFSGDLFEKLCHKLDRSRRLFPSSSPIRSQPFKDIFEQLKSERKKHQAQQAKEKGEVLVWTQVLAKTLDDWSQLSWQNNKYDCARIFDFALSMKSIDTKVLLGANPFGTDHSLNSFLTKLNQGIEQLDDPKFSELLLKNYYKLNADVKLSMSRLSKKRACLSQRFSPNNDYLGMIEYAKNYIGFVQRKAVLVDELGSKLQRIGDASLTATTSEYIENILDSKNQRELEDLLYAILQNRKLVRIHSVILNAQQSLVNR